MQNRTDFIKDLTAYLKDAALAANHKQEISQ